MPSDSVSCPWGLDFETKQLLLTYHCLDLEVLLSFPVPVFSSLPPGPADVHVCVHVCVLGIERVE